MVPFISRILHQPNFMARLQLPPRHPDFPHPALLHAICAVSARYSAAVKVSTVAESIERTDAEQLIGRKPGGAGYIEDEIAAITCFAERNFRYAELQAEPEGMLGRKLLEVSQAQVCRYCSEQILSCVRLGLTSRSSHCTTVSSTPSESTRLHRMPQDRPCFDCLLADG
jgi:hypothetical protein